MIPPRTSRRSGALAALAILPLLAATACSQTDDAAATDLIVATGESEPECLDPHVGGNWPQAEIGQQFLESLFSRDEDGEVVPWLATDAALSDDQLAWTVTLHDDIAFSDGTPFDADAVVANIEHIRDPETLSSTGILALEKVDAVVAVDAHTVRFEMREPDSALPASLAQTWLAMESPAGIERGMDENCAAPIGTGAFAVDSWTPQQSVVLVRNPDHTPTLEGEAAVTDEMVQRIEWRFIPDAASRVAALQSGQVHVIDQVEPTALASLTDDDRFQTLLGARPGVTARVELNGTGPVFGDERVREAFLRSFDADAAVESLFAGTIERSTSILASSLAEAVSFDDAFVADPAAADALLDEAGWTERDEEGVRMRDGQRLTVRFPLSTNQSIPAEISLVEQLAESAKAVGFDVQLQLLDIGSWYAAAGAWEFDAIIAPYSKDSADVLRIVYDSAGIPPAPSGYHANNTGLADPALDAILREAAVTFDADERSELYAEAQRIIVEGHWVLPLYDQMVIFAATDELDDFILQPNLNLPNFVNATLS